MRTTLETYLNVLGQTGDHHRAVVAAAEMLHAMPWRVVAEAGLLARCDVQIAQTDLGLTRELTVCGIQHPASLVDIQAGQPYPVPVLRDRRTRSASDVPLELARRVVQASLRSVTGELTTGMDIACGAGAFLLAMHEAGVPEVYGTDLDPVSLSVAQIAVPEARLLKEDPLKWGPEVDLVVGAPPVVPPQGQDPQLRAALRRRFPWLRGRFDLIVPFAASASERCRPGGAVGLVLPEPTLVQPYGAVLRRRLASRHRIVELSGPHSLPLFQTPAMVVVMTTGAGPSTLPVHGIHPSELLRLDSVPLSPDFMPGDVELVEQVRGCSLQLGTVAIVEAGLILDGPDSSAGNLLFVEPHEGRVPFATSDEYFAGERRWLQYQPGRIHRPRTSALFDDPKIVIERSRGQGGLRAAIDWHGVYVDHSCTLVVPRDDRLAIERLLLLLRSPLVDGMLKIERGVAMEMYPKDVATVPVPERWFDAPELSVEQAFGLNHQQAARLRTVSARF